MDIEQQILHKLNELPQEKQHEVLDFVTFLANKATRLSSPSEKTTSQRSFKGMFADLGVHITEEDIAEARQAMWGHSQKESV